MIWKSLGVLGVAVAVILLGVVGLAQITVPDVPTFEDGLEAGEDFIPTAVGARLQVTGAREGTIDLESDDASPALEGSKTKLFFSSDPLAVDQLYYDGLTFFPEPDDCEFTTGRHNEELGLVAVEMSCPELIDIRDNGSISVEGRVALPAGMVVELGIPDTGGTITVGDEEWTIPPDLMFFVGGSFIDDEPGFALTTEDLGNALFIGYDETSDSLSVRSIATAGNDLAEIPSGECTISDEMLMVISPETQVHELSISCEEVDVPGIGPVPIEGTVVYQKVRVLEEP